MPEAARCNENVHLLGSKITLVKSHSSWEWVVEDRIMVFGSKAMLIKTPLPSGEGGRRPGEALPPTSQPISTHSRSVSVSDRMLSVRANARIPRSSL